MQHRIRAAAVILDAEQRLLLVREYDSARDLTFWVPPGGGLEAQDASIIDCLRREVREETGLLIEVDRLVYLREFSEHARQIHHLELFFEAWRIEDGSGAPLPPTATDADLVRPARWFREAELADLVVFPAELKARFWQDRRAGEEATRYLGASSDYTEGDGSPEH